MKMSPPPRSGPDVRNVTGGGADGVVAGAALTGAAVENAAVASATARAPTATAVPPALQRARSRDLGELAEGASVSCMEGWPFLWLIKGSESDSA
jgi:hypothetical protein